MKKSLNKFLFLLIIIALSYSCTKKKTTVETNEITNPSVPTTSNDYRNAFTGAFAGVKIKWTSTWLPTNPSSYSYTEEPPVNYTITVAKVANTDSLIFAPEFHYQESSFRDTILIKPDGTYLNNFAPWHYSKVTFKNDSLSINTYTGTGAMGNISYGAKYLCKKIN